MKKNNKGFTLAELLIVVAIIAVLVAIAIPVFTSQLEKSREATDMSNVRAAYAEVMANYLANGAQTASSGSTKTVATVSIRQAQKNWQNTQNGKLQVRVNGEEKSVAVPSYDGTNKHWKVYINNTSKPESLVKVSLIS